MKKHFTRMHRQLAMPVINYWWRRLGAVFLIILSLSLVAAAQDILWDKTFGGSKADYLFTMVATPDGGYLLGGYSESGRNGDKSQEKQGKQDYWVVKMDSSGNKIWDKVYGGTSRDYLQSISPSPDGGYLLGGYSLSGISGDKSQASQGSYDYWIVKINDNGDKLWDKTIGASSSDYLTSLVSTPDGGYLLGGYSQSDRNGDKSQASKGGRDYWIVKITSSGDKVWDKSYGGNSTDYLKSMIATSDGGYLLGGQSNSGISGDKTEAHKGYSDYWAVKINSNGDKVWDKTFGTSGLEDFFEVINTPDGGYLLGGYTGAGFINGDKTEPGRGSDDYWVVKINRNGAKEWDKTIGGLSWDMLRVLVATPDGGYLLGGISQSGEGGEKSERNKGPNGYPDYWVVKLNSQGQKLWDKTIGGSHDDDLQSILLTPDGNYLLGGNSVSNKGEDKSEDNREADPATTDYWVVKFSEAHPLSNQWNIRYGGTGNDIFTDAIRTSDGGYLAGGYSNSAADGDKTQANQGQNDYWIVKTDKNGKKLWDKRFGGSADDYLNRIIQTQDGGYLLGGSSLFGNNGDKTEDNQGDRDYWVVKVDKQGNKQWDKRFGGSGYDELKKVIQLTSGEYVLGGYSNSPIGGDKSQANQGGTDYWLVKINSTGTKIWDKRYGGNLDDKLSSFTATRDEGFFLGGTSSSGNRGDKSQVSRGGLDFWVIKTDQAGNLLWDKTFGGTRHDEVYSVGRSSGNYLFIAGTSRSGNSGDKYTDNRGGQDYWLIKLTATGSKLWDQSFGGSQNDILRASTYTQDGNYVLAGTSFSGANGDLTQAGQGGSDYWFITVNAKGEKIVNKRLGGSNNEDLRTVFQTNDGGLLLGGSSSSGVSGDKTQPGQGGNDYWLVKLAPETTSLVAARESTPEPEMATPAKSLQVNAYPNPFSGQANIRFTLPETQMATVKVYDGQGREITTLFQGEAKANQTYEVEWQAGSKTAGIYLLQLQTPTLHQQRKLLLRK